VKVDERGVKNEEQDEMDMIELMEQVIARNVKANTIKGHQNITDTTIGRD
jgi:hypothetical protein